MNFVERYVWNRNSWEEKLAVCDSTVNRRLKLGVTLIALHLLNPEGMMQERHIHCAPPPPPEGGGGRKEEGGEHRACCLSRQRDTARERERERDGGKRQWRRQAADSRHTLESEQTPTEEKERKKTRWWGWGWFLLTDEIRVLQFLAVWLAGLDSSSESKPMATATNTPEAPAFCFNSILDYIHK